MKKKIKIEYEDNNNNNNNSNNNINNSDDDNSLNKIIINDSKPVNHELSYHKFNDNEIKEIRKLMVEWYNKNKRDLPWRNHDGLDENVRAYRVWVSEIMLQQTKVITVIDYFNKWVKKWPTVKDLSNTTIEEVNQMWSGLGYYRRAKNLYLGSKYVEENFKGIIPKQVKQLLEIPGIGQYTAGAISSIAFGLQEPLVDGNVIRVFSRLRSIGANPKNSKTIKLLWSIGSDIVDPDYPGQFNQSLMELGASLCSVQSPQCKICPVQSLCQAYKEEKSYVKPISKNSISNFFQPKNQTINDENNSTIKNKQKDIKIKDLCTVCENWEDTDSPTESVCKYPKKVLKVKPRDEIVDVFIVHHYEFDKYLLVQRPDTGLLASLFEAPSLIINQDNQNNEEDDDDEEEDEDIQKSKKRKQISKVNNKSTNNNNNNNITNEFIQKEILNNLFLKKSNNNSNDIITIKSFKNIGTVIHKFSHITQTLNVYDCKCQFDINNLPKTVTSKNIKWSDLKNIKLDHGMAKQMSKCFDLLK